MNSLLYNLFYFVNGFPYAFIEINSSHCIILWGQDFWNKIASIILLIFTSRVPHLNGYRSSSIIIYTCSLQEIGLTDLVDFE